jgi:hypothetical protein
MIFKEKKAIRAKEESRDFFLLLLTCGEKAVTIRIDSAI